MSEKVEYEDDEANNREKKKYEMVLAAHRKNKESGVFETIQEIFSRLPLPRLEKNGYKFLFEGLKENVETVLKQEDYLKNLYLII